MKWHSAQEVCEVVGISRSRLTQLRNGTKQHGAKSTGKVYYTPAVISPKNTKIVMTGSRAAVYYNDDAINEVREYLRTKDSWKARFHGGKK